MLGLANKAGKLVTGEEVVRNSVRNSKVKLLLISEDASDNTKKRFLNTADYYKVPVHIWGLKEQLGSNIGKSERAVIGICDDGFAKSIASLLQTATNSIGDIHNQIDPTAKKSGGELNEQNESI